MTRPLAGQIVLVAGASRGVGRGIARGLGEAGATVIVTGRSSEAGAITDARRETVENAARDIIAAGGDAHPYRCDHTSEREIDGLLAWVLRRFGRVDALVACVWGGNEGFDGERYPDGSHFGTPFWRRPAARLGETFNTALSANFLTIRAFAPVMVAAGRGSMVIVTADADDAYLGDLFYDLAKASQKRLAFAIAEELLPHGVVALALAPGHSRTERVVDAGMSEEATESPLYAGRALAHLLTRADLSVHAGAVLHVGDIARDHGVVDEDGSQPERFRL